MEKNQITEETFVSEEQTLQQSLQGLKLEHKELCDAVRDMVNVLIRIWQELDMDKRNAKLAERQQNHQQKS